MSDLFGGSAVSWPLVEIDKVISFIRGITFKPEDQVEPFTEDSIVVMRTKNIQVEGLYVDDLIAVNKSFVRREELYLKEGDLLISSANSWELVGKTSYVTQLDYKATAGGFISIVRPVEELIDAKYLYYWISSPENQLKIRMCGRQTTNISNLDVGRFKSLEIPLPPLAEQKRIAAILDKADAIRRKRQQAIKLADEFLRSVFLDMFGDPVSNPKGWDVKKVGEVCDCIVPGRDKPKSFTGSIPWVTTNELCHLGVTLKNEKFIGLSEDEIKEVKAKIVPAGSVVMTCVGDLGVVSTVGNDMVINQQLHAFLPSAYVTPAFLCYALAWQKEYMIRMASSTTLPYMNKAVCNSIPVILPPIDIQETFERVVEKIREIKSGIDIFSFEKLFESLSQKAFSGQL